MRALRIGGIALLIIGFALILASAFVDYQTAFR